MKKKYLSDLIEQYKILDNLNQQDINLIHSYAGSGKTYFILDYISKSDSNIFGEEDNQFFYICDTKLLKQQFQGDYELRKAKINGIEVEQLYKIGKYGEYIPMSCHVMTYYGWLYFMKLNHDKIGKYSQKIFFFDEPQALVQNINSYSDYDEEEVINYIDLILKNDSTIVATSATPEKFIGLMNDYNFTINDLLHGYKNELKQYTSDKVIRYNEKPHELLSHIPHAKVLIYWCGSIKEMENEANLIRKKLNLNVCCIYSDTKSSLEQKALKERIITNNDIPVEYDVVIFNKSMGTGVNIIDKNHEFNTFITYATKHEYLEDDDIYQARMRIRHDIEVEYHFTKAHDIKKEDKDMIRQHEEYINRIDLIEDILNQKLTTEQFKELAIKLNFRTQTRKLNNKPISEIETLGYKVENKRTKSERYVIISER